MTALTPTLQAEAWRCGVELFDSELKAMDCHDAYRVKGPAVEPLCLMSDVAHLAVENDALKRRNAELQAEIERLRGNAPDDQAAWPRYSVQEHQKAWTLLRYETEQDRNSNTPVYAGFFVTEQDAKDVQSLLTTGAELTHQRIAHLEQALERFKSGHGEQANRAALAEQEYEQSREQILHKDEALTALRTKVDAQATLIASAKRLLSKQAPDGVAMGLEDPSKLAWWYRESAITLAAINQFQHENAQ